MSDYDGNRSNDTLDETGGGGGGADNSIIGKVKSRVSSIFPHSLSKWFSPSTKNNDSMNGSLNVTCDGVRTSARRRRRIELDEDEDDVDDEEDVGEEEEDEEDDVECHHTGESLRLQTNANMDEDSNNSDDVVTSMSTFKECQTVNTSSSIMRQPPIKRTRLDMDITNKTNTSSVHLMPLQASTPSVSCNVRGGVSNRHSLERSCRTAGAPMSRYTHMHLYGHQSQKGAAYNFNPVQNIIEPTTHNDVSYSENPSTSVSSGISMRRSLNIPTVQYDGIGLSSNNHGKIKQQVIGSGKFDAFNTRASVKDNMPKMGLTPSSTSTTILEIENWDDDDDDDDDDNDNDNEEYPHTIIEKSTSQLIKNIDESNKYFDRPMLMSTLHSSSRKRQRLVNGGENDGDVVSGSAENLVDTASENSEEVRLGDDTADINSNRNQQRKTGLFTMSGTNSRTGSRTSSFGNGLNFYSHLEGRKSLFSGKQGQTENPLNNSTLSLTSLNRRQFNASIYGSTSALSDSRLLNTFSPFYKGRTTYGGAAAYNRFGASAGAGASAMRITPTLIRPTSSLSTLSSSNNSLATAGANPITESGSAISSTAKRILDLINDFTTPLNDAKKMATSLKSNSQQQQQQQQQQQLLLPHNRSRLNEADLHESRAIRLSQVRTPYMRPMVTLHPTHINGKAASSQSMLSPPVRELQVPSMSQLLQMKRLQNTTERSREMVTHSNMVGSSQRTLASTNEYTLPVRQSKDDEGDSMRGSGVGSGSGSGCQQQRHNNKIRTKIATHARVTNTKIDDDAPPPPINLRNIEFPTMQSVPKIDINLSTSIPTSSSTVSTTITTNKSPAAMKFSFTGASTTATTDVGKFGSNSSDTFAFNSSGRSMASDRTPLVAIDVKSNLNTIASSGTPMFSSGFTTTTHTQQQPTGNFKFSAPLELNASSKSISAVDADRQYQYKFSPPMTVQSSAVTTSAGQRTSQAPQLKSGSVLDALKKPFTPPQHTNTTVASAVSTPVTSQTITLSGSGFGNQFKKSTGEWECDTCCVRNKLEAVKCVACETARKPVTPASASAASTSSTSSSSSTSLLLASPSPSSSLLTTPVGAQQSKQPSFGSSFGTQFKKAANEWECDSCMVRNKEANTKCVACEAPRKGATTATAIAAVAPIKSSFGDAFKPKSNTWECPTCLIQNKSEANACIACETKKPGATATAVATAAGSGSTTTAPAFKFGFAAVEGEKPKADAGFTQIVQAQKASKWECEACMTLNDAARNKCICCEQAKPGSQPTTTESEAPKFSFGSSAAAKFTFGFGNANTAVLKSDGGQSSTTTITMSTTAAATAAAGVPKTDAQVKGFGTASTPSSGGFTFGIKPITSINSAGGKTNSTDTADAAAKSTIASTPNVGGFKFGIATGTVASTPSASAAAMAFTAPTVATTATSQQSSTTADISTAVPAFGTTTTTSPSVKFGLASAAVTSTTSSPSTISLAATKSSDLNVSNASTPSFTFGVQSAAATTAAAAAAAAAAATTTTTTTLTGAGSTGGFSFGVPAAKVPAAIVSNTTTAAAPTSLGGFAFKTPDTVATVTSTSSTTNPANVTSSLTSAFKFGAPATSATTAAASATPMFNFGASAAASGNGSAATLPKPDAATIATASPTTGFTFGSGASTTSPNAKLLFGNAAAATAAATPMMSSAATAPTVTAVTATPAAASKVFGSFDNGGVGTSAFGMGSGATSLFGAQASSSTATVTATTSSMSQKRAAASTNATSSPAAKTLFGTATTMATPQAASTKVFGSFDSGASTFGGTAGGATSLFGSPKMGSPSSALGATTATGTAAPSTTLATSNKRAAGSTNIFGSFGEQQQQQQQQQGSASKIAATSVFGASAGGNAVPSSSAALPSGSSTPFVFGSGATAASAANTGVAAVANTTATSTWPQNSFVFGSGGSGGNSAATNIVNATSNKMLFGGFDSVQQSQPHPTATANNVAATSIFGNLGGGGGVAAATTPVFGSVAANNNNNNNSMGSIFGAAGNVNAQPGVTNIFGANTATNSNNNGNDNNLNTTAVVAPQSAFGAATFGSGATPTFGSAANTVQPTAATTFGGFGAVSTNTDGGFAEKAKPAFNFGATATQGATGGFNFGGSAATPKAAFNFAPSSQPAFNFTGSQPEQQPTQTQAIKPFQFGAPTAAPVFNFSGTAVEGTPNAPFQFNAGASPAAMNIFAPTPTPGAQNAQQARRKMRAPIRRLTPR